MHEVNLFYSFAIVLCYIVCNTVYRVKITGLENIPKEGPLLLYSNHLSMMDMFVLSYKCPRVIHYMSKAELFKIPVLAQLIKWVGGFPVSRGTGDVGSVRTVLKLLKDGKTVGIFPEGTRMRKNKRVRAKGGAAMFALRSGATIQPVAIRGSYRLFSRIEVVFGKPYKLQYDRKSHFDKDELQKITDDIMDNIYSLIDYKTGME